MLDAVVFMHTMSLLSVMISLASLLTNGSVTVEKKSHFLILITLPAPSPAPQLSP